MVRLEVSVVPFYDSLRFNLFKPQLNHGICKDTILKASEGTKARAKMQNIFLQARAILIMSSNEKRHPKRSRLQNEKFWC